ncbi:MAG: pyruvate:ferredoxin (flavodoxin) oxidoreductase [Planctomycetia bacterium]|nr:pyruvate:ferredoxin (flavodoxin) oxidoreductase [Planctomycetia bacterium]
MSDEKRFVMCDGNEAAAMIAHLCNEVMAIYPITPSSTMGELTDDWAAKGKKNLFGTVPHVIEMQSEAGAAGAVHGSLQAGALTCTFTASQGLLLMIPNMFKIAGEQTPTVFHVTARCIATHALSIFGDHSDVMATRSCGWAMLAAGSVQETHDLALISYASTHKSHIPFLHFFDGFRTSHEVNKLEKISDAVVREMIDLDYIKNFRERALNPQKPIIRGTAQNPDVFFQAREACNPAYNAVPAIVQEQMDKFAQLTGRQYHLFDYYGDPNAENVIVIMASGAGIVEEYLDFVGMDKNVGYLNVRLYRPFDANAFVNALPKSVKRIAVLDRTKEPGSAGEPLYQDVVTAMMQKWNGAMPKIYGGRFGLASKDFTPAMVKGVFDALAAEKLVQGFTVGIKDDLTNLSVEYDPNFSTEKDDVRRCIFYGLGSDGTVGANKETTKIVGEYTPNFSQGYFVYDSKKAGAVTISHLRFSPRPIKGSYQIYSANFVACHQFVFTTKVDMLSTIVEGGTFLLNSPYSADEVWDHLPIELQEEIISKKLKFYVVDAVAVAKAAGMGGRINTVMETCFFKLGDFMPVDEGIERIKAGIQKVYGKKGPEIVEKNFKAVDSSLAALQEVKVPSQVTSTFHRLTGVQGDAPEFVKNVLGEILASRGENLTVKDMLPTADGSFPTGTTKYEKRSIAIDIPIWDPNTCIQCGNCSLVCPHAAIRLKIYDAANGAPASFKSVPAKTKEFEGKQFTLQVAPDDCTGCGMCVYVCPAKNKEVEGKKGINLENQLQHLEAERANWDYFLTLPDYDRAKAKVDTVKGSQLLLPLFEFSGSCAGCGETPYVKLVTQLFGDRMMIANATGCSSIYGGNLPTTPYTTNAEGCGPAWCNSLFEDNAEFGLGMRAGVDQQLGFVREILAAKKEQIGAELVENLLNNKQETEAEIAQQRAWVKELKAKLAQCNCSCDESRLLADSADYLVRRSAWIIGGDGWAYDIGYGGLDHVVASQQDVNILVLDTEVYSNTGGQASKSTPKGAVAKFAAGGKATGKKDLGMMAVSYGTCFVGQISLGANPAHAIKTLVAAESYRGPSLIIAYSHCIGQGIDMKTGMELQKEAVRCGYWPLWSYDPRLEKPFVLASKAPEGLVRDFEAKQNRFKSLKRINPEAATRFEEELQADVQKRYEYYKALQDVKKN